MASVLARPLARVGNCARRPTIHVPTGTGPRSCAQCQLSTQKPLKRRTPLSSFTDAWRACAPEAAISSTACDGPAHVHAFFSWSHSTRLETRTKESHCWARLFCGCACSFFLCLFSVATELLCAHLRMAQMSKRLEFLPRCLMQKRIVCLVLAHIHGHACCLFILLVIYSDPTISKSK